MIVRGIDFTSRPTKRKPIRCFEAALDETVLHFESFHDWRDFESFETAINLPGPWIAGIDLPFGQARRFIESIGWPRTWRGYTDHVASLNRQQFRDALNAYRQGRNDGDREHRRETDKRASSISPQKLYGVPVALMFFEGATRLANSAAHVPGVKSGDPERIIVEAYPGVLARRLINRRPYKSDDRRKQTTDQRAARLDMVGLIANGESFLDYGLRVEIPDEVANAMIADGSGDCLDAMLCAIQAGWAWMQRATNFGAPSDLDPLEGWIADPSLRTT